MKTISKFTTKAVEIRMCMTSCKDEDFFKGTYKVTEKPKLKDTKWGKETSYFDYGEEAKNCMLTKINFWLH